MSQDFEGKVSRKVSASQSHLRRCLHSDAAFLGFSGCVSGLTRLAQKGGSCKLWKELCILTQCTSYGTNCQRHFAQFEASGRDLSQGQGYHREPQQGQCLM